MSSLIARNTNRWHLNRRQRPERTPIEIDIANVNIDATSRGLVQCLESYEADFRDLDVALKGRDLLRLSYEDDIEGDPAVGYRRVCAHLGIEPENVEPRLVRTTPYPLAQIIVNRAEVEAALAATPFAWMIRE